MSLTAGSGPFGTRPAGRFNFEPQPPGSTIFWEPVPYRVRALVAGETVADSRSARDSRSIETIGHYNPRTDPVEFNVDAEKAKAWLAKGAQPSDTVARLFRNAGVLPAAK